MKRKLYIFFVVMFCCCGHVCQLASCNVDKPTETETEAVSVFKKVKSSKQNKQCMRDTLADGLEKVLFETTKTIRMLTEVVDAVAKRAKELAGCQDGVLANADKAVLQQCQREVDELLQKLFEVQKLLSERNKIVA